MRTEPAPLHPTLAALGGCPRRVPGARCWQDAHTAPLTSSGLCTQGRWPEQWASRDATSVAHSISKYLPYTVLVTHLRHELALVWVWGFPGLKLPAQPCVPCPTKGRTRGDLGGSFGGVCTGIAGG